MPSNTPPKMHPALMKPIVKEFISELVSYRYLLNWVMLSASAFGSSLKRQPMLGSRFGLEPFPSWSLGRPQIRVKKAERVRWLDHTHPSSALLFENLVTKGLYSGPMHFRPEMMFGVVAVKEPDPVIELVITAHAPRNRLVRIASVMPVVAVQIRQAVAKVIEREKETDVMPIKNTEDHKSRNNRSEFEDSPKRLARILAFLFLKNRLGIFAERAQERVFEGMLRFTFVTVFVNRDPIDGLTVIVRPVGVSLVMLHVNAFVEDLAKADRD